MRGPPSPSKVSVDRAGQIGAHHADVVHRVARDDVCAADGRSDCDSRSATTAMAGATARTNGSVDDVREPWCGTTSDVGAQPRPRCVRTSTASLRASMSPVRSALPCAESTRTTHERSLVLA